MWKAQKLEVDYPLFSCQGFSWQCYSFSHSELTSRKQFSQKYNSVFIYCYLWTAPQRKFSTCIYIQCCGIWKSFRVFCTFSSFLFWFIFPVIINSLIFSLVCLKPKCLVVDTRMCKHALTQPHSVHAEHDARMVQLTKMIQDVFMQKQIFISSMDT